MTRLDIDTTRAIREISEYLQRRVARDRSAGVILGLSGGLDSSVLAALAVRALGPRRVQVVYLYDRDSDPQIAQNARLVAQVLDLPLEEIDITGEMRRRGVYRPLFVKLLRPSRAVARLSTRAFRRICGMSPFLATLRVGRGERLRPRYKRWLFDHTIRQLDRGFNQRHLYRRVWIENRAQAQNLSVIGAANLSECEVGWFVHGGIDDLPVQPMTSLYKTQVRQLARALDLPERVRRQLPSPDMAKGVSDEFGIGHDYSVVDIVLDGVDRGLSAKEIAAGGIAMAEIEDIRQLARHSDWKRRSPHEAPPVSGKFGSALRLDTPPERLRMA